MAEVVPLTFGMSVGHVAVKYGYEEAGFLNHLIFWYKNNRDNNRNFYEGRWWTWNTVTALSQSFPWWTTKQLRRIIDSCKAQGALLVGNFNEDGRDRTLWYSPSDELLTMYGINTLQDDEFPNGKMQLPDSETENSQMGKALPEIVPEIVHDKEKEIKKKKKTAPKELDEETKELLRGYVGDDGELRLKLADMIIARNERGAVNSHRAVKALLNLLDKYSEGSRALKLELLERAIASGWQTVYPLKPWEAAAILSDLEAAPAGSGRFQSAEDSGERIIRPEDSPWYRYKKEQENGKV